MPSSTSPIDGGERQALGENPNAWGAPRLNNALTAVAETAAGRTTVPVGAADVTLDSSNWTPTVSGHYRYALHVLTAGVGVGARNIIVPGLARKYQFANRTAYNQTVKTAGGTGAIVRAGQTTTVDCDGTDCVIVDPTLDTIKAPTASVALNGQKITGLANGVAATDAATVGQLDLLFSSGGGGSYAQVLAARDAALAAEAEAEAHALASQTWDPSFYYTKTQADALNTSDRAFAICAAIIL